MEEYRTILDESEAVFAERRSRFVCRSKPVQSEEEALGFLHEIRTSCWDANHNVFAYSLRAGGVRRFSDDGEPQGTAGMPVLDVLLKSEVTDAAVVVTRYFGGILLGAGGLVRAYSHGASLALEQAKIIVMRFCLCCSLKCEYGEYGKVSALLPESGGVVDHAEFTDAVEVAFHIAPEALPEFEKKLADVTRGTCHVKTSDGKYYKI